LKYSLHQLEDSPKISKDVFAAMKESMEFLKNSFPFFFFCLVFSITFLLQKFEFNADENSGCCFMPNECWVLLRTRLTPQHLGRAK